MGGNQQNPMKGENQKKEGGAGNEKQENPMNAKGEDGKDKKDGKSGKTQAEKERDELEKKLAEIGGKESKDRDRKDKDLNADLRKGGQWGKLPERIRDQLDVHARERFMPRYEDLLRQYYRTIAEQGTRRKEGE